MAQFSYSDFEKVTNRPAASGNANADGNNSVKIGFFKLPENGECLVRFNVSSVEDLQFAAVHKPKFGAKFTGLLNPYAGISCLNDINSYSDSCPFCQAAKAKHPVIDSVKKLVFVPMLVSYKDAATGAWSNPVPVIWERPAGFARELSTKLQNFGDLRQSMFKVTRTGKSTETRYILDYAVPMIFKPEMIPTDFTAFDGFKANKQSYWEMSAAEMNDFITNGAFSTAQTAPAANSLAFVATGEDSAAMTDSFSATTANGAVDAAGQYQFAPPTAVPQPVTTFAANTGVPHNEATVQTSDNPAPMPSSFSARPQFNKFSF